jgi:hypothetical protein
VPRVTVLPNGVTASCPRFGPMADTAPRGVIRGWSVQAVARQRRWFYSVDGAALDGIGHALTLTVRDLPPAAGDWTRIRKNFFDRLRRAAMLRGQWLTEWQRRGVPHLHGIVYFPEGAGDFHELVVGHWLDVAADYAPDRRAQVVKPVWGLPGWLQYQAKHSARGIRHYQRATVPAAWQKGTGRLWGTSGDWPTREELVPVSMEAYWRFRRGLRSWLIAGARAGSDYRRLSWLRRMLADPEASRSAVRAVGEFVPEAVSWQLLHASLLDAELVPPGVSRGRK